MRTTDIMTLAGAIAMPLVGGCATVTAPSIDVLTVQIEAAGLLDQSLRVVLCAFNPNARPLTFDRISFELTIAGEPFAEGVSETAVRLPSERFVPVPVAIATTLRHLDAQLSAIVERGALPYRLHGSVRLAGSLGLTVPFSRSGELGPTELGRALTDLATPQGGGCDHAA